VVVIYSCGVVVSLVEREEEYVVDAAMVETLEGMD
jgi:hypothetical protein